MSDKHLLVIDPQNDFCDEDDGALYVKGAKEDMERLSRRIKRGPRTFSQIHVTLDCHHLFDIAHPMFWVNEDGEHPDPFTVISSEDVVNGAWRAAKRSLQKHCLDYVEKLESGGRYPLCVWPPHCLIGSPGNNIVAPMREALDAWIRKHKGRWFRPVSKGSNPLTEHYSAVKAEVPMDDDPDTMINTRLIEVLESADEIAVAGEAGSHCLANTVRDIAEAFSDSGYVSKIVLLEDATSPVTGLEGLQDQFVKDMTALGMRTCRVDDY